MLSLKQKFQIQIMQKKIKHIFVSDLDYAKKRYYKWRGEPLNLDNPTYFAEKLQYLKLYYRNPLMKICADKLYAREYVKACGYPHVLKKIYAVYNDVSEIDTNKLPKSFFIRWNHMSGGNFKITDGVIPEETKDLLTVFKKINWYHNGREWQYDNIIPKLICEEVLKNSDGSPLADYKFYCFGGEVKYYMVSYGEYEHEHVNHKFAPDGTSIDKYFKKKESIAASDVKIPENIQEMIQIAERLSKPFPHVRVDFYNIDGRIVFGEMTFFSDSGFVNINSKEFDREIGSWIHLEDYEQDMVK